MSDSLILNRQRSYPIRVPTLKQFLLRLGRRLKIQNQEFAVLLTNDRTIRRFNRQFRDKNNTTDVLSFPSDAASKQMPRFENRYLGDIIVSVETARRQAFARNHSLETELRILLIHGMLHLLGFDHETDQGQMRRKELRLQKELL